MDWKMLMSIQPENLSEQEKDNLFNLVADYSPDIKTEKSYLFHFVRVIQEVLKFKAEQVEYLTGELDEIAARQGKEEGSKLSIYTREIELLRRELEFYKGSNLENDKSKFSSIDELKRDLVSLEMQRDELLGELKKQEKDLLYEKGEVEKYAARVAVLETEKLELARELKAVKSDVTEKNIPVAKISPDFETERSENLIEVVREKNKHISLLLEDIEIAEEENLSLKTKLACVKDELSETATHMTEITAELATLKQLNEKFKIENIDLSEKIKSLMFHIEEVVDEKSKNDKQLDDYIKMFNIKLQEWKDVLHCKDVEILKLKQELNKFSLSSAFHGPVDSQISSLNLKIEQQGKELNILQEELQKATDEINNSTDLIEKLKEKNFHLISLPEHNQSLVTHYEKKIKYLEEKLKYAEEDAFTKAEEMSGLVIQLRQYEAGVFGLSEAVLKNKKLEKLLQEKALHIEKLVSVCNNLEIRADNLEEQNLGLKEKLGLSASDKIDTSFVKLKYKKEEKLLEVIKLQLQKKEEELVQMKLKYRRLVKFFKLHSPRGINDSLENSKKVQNYCLEWKKINEKLKAIILENDALRKGMHEILESIRQQDCSGTVEVQSACLERLLKALDSRHVSGWYHPAMRLQAQLSTAEGKNEELRSQIRSLKTEERKRASELQNAYLKIQSLESDTTPRLEDEKTEECNICESDCENNTNKGKPSICGNPEQKIIVLESELLNLRHQYDGIKLEMDEMKNSFFLEKENLLAKITELESFVHLYKSQNLNPNSSKLVELTSHAAVLERKVNFLQNWESVFRKNDEELKREMLCDKEKMLREILKLQNDKSELFERIQKQEEDILSKVSREKFYYLKNELASVRSKYQRAIKLSLIQDEGSTIEILKAEIKLLQNEKQELLIYIKSLKEKSINMGELEKNFEEKTNVKKEEEITLLREKLEVFEIHAVEEKQKMERLEKLNEILKSQQQQLKIRNNELVEEVVRLTENLEKQQETEKAFKAKELDRFSEEEKLTLMEKIKSIEEKCKELLSEKRNIQELFEISQGQCRTLEEWKNMDKILVASLKEQIMVLQASTDNKAAFSRLSHELTAAKLTASQFSKKIKDLELNVSKLLAQKMESELKTSEKSRELAKERKKHLALIEHLYQSLDEVRESYGGTVRFRSLEDIFYAKAKLKEVENNMLEKTKELNLKIQEYSLKTEEMEIQLNCIEDLKLAFKGESENIIRWHNKNTELRLKEAKSRRKNEFLTGEIFQLENGLKKLNEEISALEEENVKNELEWESKQVLWEKAQMQMCKLLKQKSSKIKPKNLLDASTNTNNLSEAVPSDTSEYLRLKNSEVKMRELEAEIIILKKKMKEKDEIIEIKEELVKSLSAVRVSKTVNSTKAICREKMENAEREALKVTVRSFQNIIKQKEETILRYQDLLQQSREKYGNACAKFQCELMNLNEAMATQNIAYKKLKNTAQTRHSTGENISIIVENFVEKIHELEEELKEYKISFSTADCQAIQNKQQVDKWKSVAAERLSLIEDMRQRFERECQSEVENYKEELKKKQDEIERLNRNLDIFTNGAGTSDSRQNSSENMGPLEGKVMNSANNQIHLKSDLLSDRSFDKSERQKYNHLSRELEILKERLTSSKNESTRLRGQIRLLQFQIRRPKTSRSSLTKTNLNGPDSEENLTSKIKRLEELLSASKEKEREVMELNEKKLKSVEEVSRWDERKKSQQTIQQLSTRLKEKDAEVSMLKNKNDSLRNMVHKCEKEKSILEAQLKIAKGNSVGADGCVEKLTVEKNQLETEVETLRTKLDEHSKHCKGISACLLQKKLEEQERKLAAFELGSKGQNVLIEELERLKTTILNLEKANLKLESENLALRLQLEAEKTESKYLLETLKNSHDTSNEVSLERNNRKSTQLHKKKVDLENINELQIRSKEPLKPHLVEMRHELAKLSKDYRCLKVKYMEAIDNNIALEKEVKSCRYQIQLMEEKDLTEILAGSNNSQSTSQLSQELIEVKSKLAQKTHLLNRVKALLLKAAAKEKALQQEVSILQNLIPESALHARS